MPLNSNGIILDTCVIINLLQGNIFDKFLNHFSEVSISRYSMEKELLFLTESNDLIDKKVFQNVNILFPNEYESELLINLSEKIDTGEAHAMTLALSREMDFATDDKKAIRVFKSFGNSKKIWTTPEILFKQFYDKSDSEFIREVLTKITSKARFVPSNSNEYYSWWMKFLR